MGRGKREKSLWWNKSKAGCNSKEFVFFNIVVTSLVARSFDHIARNSTVSLDCTWHALSSPVK